MMGPLEGPHHRACLLLLVLLVLLLEASPTIP
jgi:hypothetical protein